MKNKVIVLDWGILSHRSIFASVKNPGVPATYICLSSVIGNLKRIGVNKQDKVIIAVDARNSWRKDYEACLIADTEVLTDNGWKLLKDIVENKEKIKVATLNQKTNKVEYDYPNDYHKVYYKGKLYAFGGLGCQVDIVATPKHNHYVKKQYEKIFYLKSIEELPIKGERNHNRKFNYNKIGLSYFRIPKLRTVSTCMRKAAKYTYIVEHSAKKIKIDDWLGLLGWYLTEGSCGGRRYCGYVKPNTVVIPQSPLHNPEYCKEILNILKKFGSVTQQKRKNIINFVISNTQLARYLKNSFGNSFSKYIPRKFLNQLSKKQCKLLLKTMIKGDGSIYHKKTVTAYSYTTVSKKLADDVQELSLKAGYACSITKPTTNRTWYGLNITTSFTPRNTKHEYRGADWAGEGYVYDITVPNHIFYIRRNGKCCWTGNSYKGDRSQKRKESPIDWDKEYKQMNWLLEKLDLATNFNQILLPRTEADDIMSSCARHFKDNEIILLTYDSDMNQLTSYGNVKIFSPMTKRYKIMPKNYNAQKDILKKVNKEASDNLINPILSEVDFDNRLLCVNLLELPINIESQILAELDNLPAKENHLELLPYPTLRDRFMNIYGEATESYEKSRKYYERKEKAKMKKKALKRGGKK